jgi:molybdopterin converting factor subunit 1
MRVTVRVFARLRELMGTGELTRDTADGATVADVWDALARDYPAVAPYAASMSCAVNAEYARMTTPVHEGDEIAFLPPVSGGAALH